ncbi:MAG: hypothetical protein A2030_05425 [Chloroflexi bacterium RBG_19FT_COMBO_50_10]|nr:MAG: hypothetical protein A2030_05425 [Chloroflexi bacterium RBG_19FT_COMBO_50_10]
MCNTCEMIIAQAGLDQAPYERGLEEYPPEWQQDFQRLSTTIFSLADRYQNDIQIRIWDPRTFQGMLKSIRHWVRQYPTFIVNGNQKVKGWDIDRLEQLIRLDREMSDFEI